METLKTKSIRNIEEKMAGMETDSLRCHVLESAKNFKTSWIELGRALYSVWKDKMFKSWGYTTFDAYAASEIGIKKQTAVKLLKSYYFLEKEEPQYLEKDNSEPKNVAAMPSYESVDFLRTAKSKKELDKGDYEHLKKEIFEKGRDAREVKKDLTSLIRQRQELDPDQAYQKRKYASVKRLLGVLKALKTEIEISKLLPAPLIKEVSDLISKVEAEIEE